jgi:exosortase A-associated hydrolase 2
VFFPAFGDEMNQSRRMVRLAAQALGARGVESWIFDLFGTGDSSADFGDATLARWLADCARILERVQEERPELPLLLLGCRLGVGLAVQASHALRRPAAAMVGWAPLLQGKLQLSGMLRVDKLSRGQRPPDRSGDDPRTRWSAGEAAVLGGYLVSPTLADELQTFDASKAPRARRAALIELRLAAGDGRLEPSEALRKRGSEWAAQGVPTDLQALPGASFWNVADLVDLPGLIDVTVRAAESALAAEGDPGRADEGAGDEVHPAKPGTPR